MFEFKDVENLSESKNLNEEKDNFVFTADVVPAAATRCHKRGLFYSIRILKYQKFDFLFTILIFFCQNINFDFPLYIFIVKNSPNSH